MNKCAREETLMGKIFLKKTHHHPCNNVYFLPLPGSTPPPLPLAVTTAT